MPYWAGFMADNIQFQSTPDREAGRCRESGYPMNCQHLFQSTPDREAGRCPHRDALVLHGFEFQSTPDREAGRCLKRDCNPMR